MNFSFLRERILRIISIIYWEIIYLSYIFLHRYLKHRIKLIKLIYIIFCIIQTLEILDNQKHRDQK